MNRILLIFCYLIFCFVSSTLFAQRKLMVGVNFSPNYDSYIHVPEVKEYFYNTQKYQEGDFGFTSGFRLSLPLLENLDFETGV